MAKKNIAVAMILILLGSVFTLVYLAITGNQSQMFTDVVIGDAISVLGNKSGEMRLLYLLSFGGSIIILLFHVLKISKQSVDGEQSIEQRANIREILVGLGLLFAVPLIIYSRLNLVIGVALVLAVVGAFINRQRLLDSIVFFFLCLYSVEALYRIYILFGGERSLQLKIFILIAGMISLIGLIVREKCCVWGIAILLLQVLIPFSLLLFVQSKYRYQNEIVSLHVPYRAQAFIWVLIVAFLIEAVIRIVKNWNSSGKLNQLINYGSCVTIMAWNRYNGTGARMDIDMHHHAENILGFSQIFELGQKPFTEYIPVSGMYSALEGAVFKLLGHGQLSNYFLADNLFYLLVILLLVALLRAQMNGVITLAISMIFLVIDYNRVAFILPIMLLLVWPKLVERKNLWLKVWILSSLFHGLYYPVFGAAVCVGFLPMGIWQIVTYARSGELRKDIRSTGFWLKWLLCLLPVVFSIPLLLGTYRHITAMSGQSILADGIARFGQSVPGIFLPWMEKCVSLRVVLFLLCSFLIPAGIVWVGVALAGHISNVNLKGRKLVISNGQAGCLALAIVIIPLISYTYTFVRLDHGNIYARSAGVLYAVAVVLVVLAWQYAGERIRLGILVAALLIPCVGNLLGISRLEESQQAYIEIPDDYLYVEQSELWRLGEGFIPPWLNDQITRYQGEFASADPEDSYLGTMPLYGYYYLMGVKGDSLLEVTPIKSFEATEETVEVLRNNKTKVGSKMGWVENYYLYHWLLDSGEYYWSSDAGMWVPNEGAYSQEEIWEKSKWAGMSRNDYNIGVSAGVMGNSMASLESVFTSIDVDYRLSENDNGYQIALEKTVNGEDADFIYLEFDNMMQDYRYTFTYASEDSRADQLTKYWMKKKYNPDTWVEIAWYDEDMERHNMLCEMEQGKLLIPAGAGLGWLYHNHDTLWITVTRGEERLTPVLSEVRLLKLREVQ